MEEENIDPNIQKTIKNSGLLEYYKIFRVHRKKIIVITSTVCLITIILMFFVFDLIYLSNATVKSSNQSSGLSGLLPDGIPDLEDISGLAGGGGSSKELALYEKIVTSRRCVEETIIKFGLIEEYEFQTMFDAVNSFRENILVLEKDRIAGTMTIGIYDKDPAKAKDMVDFLIFQLNTINTELKVQDAKNNREFIESRYDLVISDLKKAEDSLRIFQDINGISPDLTVQAAIKTEVEIETQIASEEVKLDLLNKILTPNQAEVIAQKEKINALKNQLSDIQQDPSNILSLKGKPDVVLNFLRLKRDVEIQNKIMATLIPLLEQSKIEENRNTPSVLMLDPPNIPDKKVKPKRLTNVIIATFMTFILSYLLFVFWEKYKLFKKVLS